MHFAAAAFGALAGAMLIFPQQAAEAAQKALALFACSVAPVLGPFMVCMLMLSSRIRGRMGLRVLLSWLCASPAGVKAGPPRSMVSPLHSAWNADMLTLPDLRVNCA